MYTLIRQLHAWYTQNIKLNTVDGDAFKPHKNMIRIDEKWTSLRWRALLELSDCNVIQLTRDLFSGVKQLANEN